MASADLIPPEYLADLHARTREEAHRIYGAIWDEGNPRLAAELGRKDRFFLLTWLLNGKFADRDWVYQRCREVESDPDGYLDLWAREHFKSTVCTYAGIIQEIIRNPEITVAIFSFNSKFARDFLKQIKREFETNDRLKGLYPEVFYAKPEKEAPTWSEDRGLYVKRKGNPKEPTLTCHGLIEGLPAGPHYDLRVYDDIITENEVTTPEMLEKATHMWRQSLNMGKEGGRHWHVGTRYHFNDPYSVMLRENLLKPRIYPATDDGTVTGKPLLVNRAYMEEKRRQLGAYIFACQWLLNPVADDAQGFKREWLRFTDNRVDPQGMNVYITCDPANEKKKNSDFSVFWVLGLAADDNIYVLDCIRDRINLTERADILFNLHRQYKPRGVAYEKYGKDSDIQHYEYRMSQENYRFSITAVGSNQRKEDRIRRLVPFFEQSKVWLPEAIWHESDNRKVNLIDHFINDEYMSFPVGTHDDMLDALARVLEPDLYAMWPKYDASASDYAKRGRSRYEKKPQYNRTWMSM